MKTQKILFAIIGLVLATTSLKATGGDLKESTTSLSIENQLAKKMTCPSFIHYQNRAVEIEIHFYVTNDFTVVVESISTNDEWLKQHAQKELANLKLLVDRDKVGKSHSIKLIYK